MGLEELSLLKILGVLICFVGAISTGLDDQQSDGHQQTVTGDIIALVSAIGYGVYTTTMRYQVSYSSYGYYG